MPKSELDKDNLIHLYSTSINMLLVMVSLSDVQAVALHQLSGVFEAVLTLTFP